MKKNPTWPGTKHPDFFGKDTAVAVRQDDEQEVAEYEALEEALKEKLDELCDALKDEVEKGIQGEEQDIIDGNNPDLVGNYSEAYFEPWLQDHASDVLEAARKENRIGDLIEALEESGVSELSLEEFFLRMDLYSIEAESHSHYGRGIYSVSEDNYENEHDWSDMLHWSDAAKNLDEFCEKHYDDLEWSVYEYAYKRIDRRTYFSLQTDKDNTEFRRVSYSLSFSIVVNFDVDAVIEGLNTEFEGFGAEQEPEEEIEQDAFYTLPPQMGGFVVKKLSAKELPEESKQLGICVGKPQYGYTDAVKQGKIDIWSVRTPSGRSKFTIEAAKKDGEVTGIVQVKGKANRLPGFTPGERDPSNVKADEVKMLEKFFTDINIDPWTISDLKPGMQAVYGPKKNPPKMVPIPKRTFDMPWAPR